MDCREIVKEAMKRQGFTTPYQLAKALGYANPSSIYAVTEGKRGLSGDRLMALLRLAGKLSIAFIFAIGVAPIEQSNAKKLDFFDATTYQKYTLCA
jgi:hypothetical protein